MRIRLLPVLTAALLAFPPAGASEPHGEPAVVAAGRIAEAPLPAFEPRRDSVTSGTKGSPETYRNAARG